LFDLVIKVKLLTLTKNIRNTEKYEKQKESFKKTLLKSYFVSRCLKEFVEFTKTRIEAQRKHTLIFSICISVYFCVWIRMVFLGFFGVVLAETFWLYKSEVFVLF
jgi:hypothetical protein